MTRALVLVAASVVTLAAYRWDPAEQAQRGRTAWRNAVTALRSGDSSTALQQLRLAHDAWPAQPAYSENLVRLATRLGDTSTVAATLRLLAQQGLGANVLADSALTALATRHATIAARRRDVEQALAGPTRSAARIVSADSLFFPEGLAIDERDGTRFISSLRHRNVWVLGADGTGRWLLPEDVSGRGAVFGVKVAADGQSLWLSLAPSPHMGRRAADTGLVAELWQVERRTGRVLRRAPLGDGKGIPGELTLHDDGSVLVSDAILGKLYRLRRGAECVETIEHPLLRSPQGIAVLGAARHAIVADWSHGLLRWDLETNAITALETPSTMALLGIDGLLRVGRDLIAVQNGVQPMRVLRVRIDEQATRVTSAETLDRPRDAAGEFTIAALRGREISYIASSSWPYWNDSGERVPNSGPLPPVTLRTFRLP